MTDFDLLFTALSLLVSVAMVVITYIDMRRRLRQERETASAVSRSMAKLIDTLREELRLLRSSSQDTAKQQLLAEREKQQWDRLKDVGKAIGWFLEHAEDDEED